MADGQPTAASQAAIEAMKALSDQELLDSLARVLEERNVVLQGLVDWAAPEHAYVPAKAITDHRFEGVVKSYSATAGYGFIDSPSIKEAFGNDVFVHGGQLGSNKVGTKVNFAVLLSKDHKPQAFDVTEGAASTYRQAQRQSADFAAGKGKAQPSFGKAGKGPGGGDGAGWAATQAAQVWNALAGDGGSGGWDGSWGGAGNNAWGGGGGENAWFGSQGDGKSGGCKGGGKDAQSKGSASNGKASGGKKGGKGDSPPSMQDMAGVTDRRFEGTIKNFNEKNGFGFIASPEIVSIFQAEIDVFLHHQQIGDFSVGDAVSFAVILNRDGKPQAKELKPAQAAAKRARWN
eukprot:TRINITY_DN249_c0_g1_i1.p2 TRINITY_DN249_c0_g1~~TRINITY_DN249_c0_g1_i1.p2  ORF type:complete len:366 (+),score=106.01 TRINITY_DN249_c0_g1_i1:61-1098(+)